jgi:hypothetical protein
VIEFVEACSPDKALAGRGTDGDDDDGDDITPAAAAPAFCVVTQVMAFNAATCMCEAARADGQEPEASCLDNDSLAPPLGPAALAAALGVNALAQEEDASEAEVAAAAVAAVVHGLRASLGAPGGALRFVVWYLSAHAPAFAYGALVGFALAHWPWAAC